MSYSLLPKKKILIENSHFIIAFLFINYLFIYKYSPRLGLNPYFIIAGYSAFVYGTALITSSTRIIKEKYYQILYWITLVIIFISSIILFHQIDPYELKVDRWSIITGFLDKLFSGEYPYLAKTHMDNYGSPLPGLFIIFTPFYLTNTVAYIQPFFIAIAGISILWVSKNPKSALLFNIMFIISPSLWYEIATRSDVFTNLLIIAIFVLIYHYKSTSISLQWPVFIGIITGLLVSTRGLAVIPLSLYFIKPFMLSSVGTKFKYLFAAILTFSATILPLYFWSPELFIKLNPLLIQTNRIPFAIQVVVIILAIILGFIRSDYNSYSRWSFLVIFGVMCFGLVYTSFMKGWMNTIFNHKFDISYFNTCLPFAFFASKLYQNKILT